MTENESVRDKTNQQEVFSMIESDVDIDYSLANKRPQILAAMAGNIQYSIKSSSFWLVFFSTLE